MKAIIFDMDGVLLDSVAVHVAAWKRTFLDEGLDLDEKTILLNEGLSFKDTSELFSKKLKQDITESDLKRIVERKHSYTKEIYDAKPFKGMQEFIVFLKRNGFKTAVVTGSNRKFVLNLMDKHFNGLFDFIVTSDDVERGKPHPEPYLKAVELLGLNKEDCIVVENAPLGIRSAKSAGLKVFALETTLNRADLKEADKVFKNHKDLIKYIKENEVKK